MSYLYLDSKASRSAYMCYLSGRTGSKVNGHKIFFDDKANQRKAIDMVMDDGLYGFSNHHEDYPKVPSLTIFELNYNEEGLLHFFQGLGDRECLIVRISMEQVCTANCITLQDKLLRKIIER